MLRALLVCVVAGVAFSADKRPELTIDGLEFTINQKDFKLDTFELHGKTFVDNYGFPDESTLPLDNRGYAEIKEKCDFTADVVPLHKYSDQASIIYYPTTPDYDTFKGYDLIPENQDNYPPGGQLKTGLNFKESAKYAKEQIKMATCRIPQNDGGAWHVQRVGPFVSTGGYDWWQVGWTDVGMLSEALKKYPEGVDVVQDLFVPVLKDGTRLNYPPIHTHHIHSLTPPGVRARLNDRPMCLKRMGFGIKALDDMVAETNCYNLTMFFEQHGDHVCQPKDDGLDCLTQGDHNYRRMVEILDVEGELNDVRPPNSPPLEWYYQIAFRWRPADPAEPVLSQVGILNPGWFSPVSQIARSLTFPSPTRAESVMFYSVKMPDGGKLRRTKTHAHSGVFEGTIMVSGEFSDVGLAEDRFVPHRGWQPLITSEIGFRDNKDLFEHIMFHLEKSQAAYDAKCVSEKEGNLRNPICRRPRPDLLFASATDSITAPFNGADYVFDRRPKMWSKPYTFTEDENVVVIGFDRAVTKPPSPQAPGFIPEFLNQHIGLMVTYEDTKRSFSVSHVYTCAHDGMFMSFDQLPSPPQLLARMVVMILFEGPPVFQGNVVALEWFFTLLFTALAMYLVHLTVWAARKVPAVDQAFCTLTEVLLTLFTTHKPQWDRLNAKGDKPVHKYEMVSLSDVDADADLADD